MNLAIPSWLFIEPNNPIKNKDKDYDEVALSEIKCIPTG